MHPSMKQWTVNASELEDKKAEIQAAGLTVVQVEHFVTKIDNEDCSKVRITAKDFAAKLGHREREFID